MTEESEPVTVEVTVAAPIESVWQSLRDPKQIRLWHGWLYDELEAEIEVVFFAHATADDAAHVLRLGDGDVFELSATEGGTRVRLIRPPYVAGTEWSAYYQEITEGWLTFLQQLRFMHEEHPGEARRTLFLSGTGSAEALPGLLAALPAAVGELCYAADLQAGRLLPDLGPGLLITATKPPAGDEQGHPSVGTMAIVTMYGLDDDQFAVQADQWTAWWRSAYPDAEDAQT